MPSSDSENQPGSTPSEPEGQGTAGQGSKEGVSSHSTKTLMPQLYQELRRLASSKLGNTGGNTLSGTALLHEAYLRLEKEGSGPKWVNQAQFFSAAGEAMRRVILDRIRAKRRTKRGGDLQRMEFDEASMGLAADDDSLLSINEALDHLEKANPEAADVVKLKFFGGLSLGEIAESMDVSLRTVNRRWTFGRVWLAKHLSEEDS